MSQTYTPEQMDAFEASLKAAYKALRSGTPEHKAAGDRSKRFYVELEAIQTAPATRGDLAAVYAHYAAYGAVAS